MVGAQRQPVICSERTLKGFGKWRTLSGFLAFFLNLFPGLSLRSNPGLKLANAFGVIVLRAE
jgi:hypothetical protein